MTVETIDGNKVLIILHSNDIETYSLDYNELSLNNRHSYKIIMRLLKVACMKSGIDIKNRSILLEAIELDSELYILVTVKNKNSKKYRRKKSECLCYNLGASGNFLNTIEHLYKQNVCCIRSSVYFYKEEYFIIFDYPSIPIKLRRVLSEFDAVKKNVIYAADVRENGKQICKNNAVEIIGRHLI